jgi:hypothetical protein
VKLSYLSTSGNITSLDRFGRIHDQVWEQYHLDSGNEVVDGAVDEYVYAYDRAGNRIIKVNELHHDFDESYQYDAIDRLKSSERADDIDQSWTLDGLGNFSVWGQSSLSH